MRCCQSRAVSRRSGRRGRDGRPRATRSSTTTHAFPDPDFRRFWPRPAIMRHDPGLAASPPVRYRLEMEGSAYSPFPLIVRSGRTASSRSGGAPRKEISASRPALITARGALTSGPLTPIETGVRYGRRKRPELKRPGLSKLPAVRAPRPISVKLGRCWCARPGRRRCGRFLTARRTPWLVLRPCCGRAYAGCCGRWASTRRFRASTLAGISLCA